MRTPSHCLLLVLLLPLFSARAQTQSSAPPRNAAVHAHMTYATVSPGRSPANRAGSHGPPAVMWLIPLSPVDDVEYAAWKPHAGYSLVQKDKMFHPHLLVVAPGSSISFPNTDPFFHNVFSLFDGKRFDLGLYEAGSTKTVIFSRQGPSYIFCNIHPEMSAVVLTLPTPYYAIADAHDQFTLGKLPPGDYDLHVWVEGATQAQIDHFRRKLHLDPGSNDLGAVTLEGLPGLAPHSNLFGRSYNSSAPSPYDP